MNAAIPRVSILIVSYNTKDMTIACIDSIYNEAHNPNFEVIVVDNQSSDGSAEAIEEKFPTVKLIRAGENLGFGRANNLAAEQAAGKYILLLNPDTKVLNNAIDNLIEFAENNPKAKIWGGRTLYEDGALNPASCWNYMTLWSIFCEASGLTAVFPNSRIFNHEGYGGWKRNNVSKVEIVSGCFFLITRDLWCQLFGFDPDYFMYAEEADLCYRAKAFAAQPMVTPNAEVLHYRGASEKIYSGKVIRLLTGKVTFIKKHWPSSKKNISLILFQGHVLIRIIGFWLKYKVSTASNTKEKILAWQHVWQKRRDWLNGY